MFCTFIDNNLSGNTENGINVHYCQKRFCCFFVAIFD